MQTQIAEQARRVREAIQRDPRQGISALVEFALANAVSASAKHQVLLAKVGQDATKDMDPSPEEVQDRIAKLLKLVSLVEEDSATSGDAPPGGRASVPPLKRDEKAFSDLRRTATIFRGRDLKKRFRGTDFELEGVDLELAAGEITAVVGQNAQGKTTLLRMVAGDLHVDSGTMSYPEISKAEKLDWTAIKSQVAYLPQELPTWYGSLQDNLHYEAALHGLYGDENEQEVAFFIDRLGLREHLGKRWDHLSGGTKLRFALAQVLVWRPKLLVLDEPLANLDVLARASLLQDIVDLARSTRYPLAVLMSSQDLYELEAVATRMVFLREGTVVFNGPVAEIGQGCRVNTFELGLAVSSSRLLEVLGDDIRGEPTFNGVGYVVQTAVELGSKALLRRLLEADIDVRYFRDITRSVRSLFV